MKQTLERVVPCLAGPSDQNLIDWRLEDFKGSKRYTKHIYMYCDCVSCIRRHVIIYIQSEPLEICVYICIYVQMYVHIVKVKKMKEVKGIMMVISSNIVKALPNFLFESQLFLHEFEVLLRMPTSGMSLLTWSLPQLLPWFLRR